jgi:serine protease Do
MSRFKSNKVHCHTGLGLNAGRVAPLTLFMFLCCAGQVLADTVVLKEGQVLTGQIIAEKPTVLYLDIGITLLSIPKDKIKEYQYTQKPGDVEPNAPRKPDTETTEKSIPENTPSHDLYRTAKLPTKTISQCVEAVSQAVVMITSPGGTGSGFFINEDGYLVTNYHVIERETKIEVTVFRKGSTGFERTKFTKIKIVALNPFVDLALLKVEDLPPGKAPFVYLGDINRIEAGQEVFAVGNPLGLERTVTNGVISSTSRAFEGLVYVQTNADINPGNSGGPLFNLAGEVIGVTNMGYIFYGGLGFAIPVDYVKHFIDNYEAFAYDKDNPNTGYRYHQPERRRIREKPPSLTRNN